MTPRLYLAAGVSALVLGLGVWSWIGTHQVAVHVHQGEAALVAGSASASQGARHEAEAAQAHAQTQQDDAAGQAIEDEVARRRAAVERARQAVSGADPAQAVGPIAPVPDQAPVDLAPVVASQTELIQALDVQHQQDVVRIADRDRELAAKDRALASYKQASEQNAASAIQFQAALAVRRPWAAGALYGTDRTVGAFVERDLGSSARVGIDIVRRPVAGGQTTLEALGRLAIRF